MGSVATTAMLIQPCGTRAGGEIPSDDSWREASAGWTPYTTRGAVDSVGRSTLAATRAEAETHDPGDDTADTDAQIAAENAAWERSRGKRFRALAARPPAERCAGFKSHVKNDKLKWARRGRTHDTLMHLKRGHRLVSPEERERPAALDKAHDNRALDKAMRALRRLDAMWHAGHRRAVLVVVYQTILHAAEQRALPHRHFGPAFELYRAAASESVHGRGTVPWSYILTGVDWRRCTPEALAFVLEQIDARPAPPAPVVEPQPPAGELFDAVAARFVRGVLGPRATPFDAAAARSFARVLRHEPRPAARSRRLADMVHVTAVAARRAA